MNFKMVKDSKNILNGIAAAPGLAIASAYLYTKEIEQIKDDFIFDVEE